MTERTSSKEENIEREAMLHHIVTVVTIIVARKDMRRKKVVTEEEMSVSREEIVDHLVETDTVTKMIQTDQ